MFEPTNNNPLQFIEDVTANADKVQRHVLAEILSRNAHVEYLQRHGLAGRTDPKTFKNLVPVISYEYIKPDIDRIASGDTSQILCSEPISEFLTRCSTPGEERKLIPNTEEETQRKFLLSSIHMPVMSQYFTGLKEGKGMYFLVLKAETKTPGGLLARPASTSFFRSSYYTERPDHLSKNYTSLKETLFCPDSYQSMYSQLLCGLYQHMQVNRVGAIFASVFVRTIWFLENHWPLLCSDIRTGTLNPHITDPSVREAVLRILKPDPKLADFIKAECSNKSWKGIITKLWPNTKFVEAIVTGSMSQYVPALDYLSNGLPIVSISYGATEGYFGVNLNPLCKPSEISYTLIPTMGYFEFLPVYRNSAKMNPSSLRDKEHQDLVDLADVKLGQEYELVVTTYAGLYRYRVGDVLRVVGFKNKAPQFNFICRRNVVLSIDSVKTDEVELQNAVNNALRHLKPYGAMLADYTSYSDTSTNPGHYVLFLEMNQIDSRTSLIPSSVFEDCCLTIEESLNSEYWQGRVLDKTIGPLEINIVEPGTFDELMDYAIASGGSINQYKTPRCVEFTSIIELLDSRAVSRYFSPMSYS